MRLLNSCAFLARLALATASASACTPAQPLPKPFQEASAAAPGPVPAKTASAAVAPAGAPNTQAQSVPSHAVVLGTAVVRRQPLEAKTVALAGHPGRQNNALATLYRGESVQLRAQKDGWWDVTLSDESHGWVKKDALLVADTLTLATTLTPARLFTRPDLLALWGNRTVDAGTLLIVLRHKDAFCEVNHGGRQSAWVLCAMLVSDAPEVGAAKLVHRARLLQQRQDPEARVLLELLRGQFGQTRLWAALSAASATSAAATAAEVQPAEPRPTPEPQSDGPSVATDMQLSPSPPQVPPERGGAPGLQGWQPPAPRSPVAPDAPAASGTEADAPVDPFGEDAEPEPGAMGEPDGVTGP